MQMGAPDIDCEVPGDQRPFPSGNKTTFYAHLSPFFKTPITDFIGGPIMGFQGTKCAEMELRMMNCFEAYGYALSQKKCVDYMNDFRECINETKQHLRADAMQEERKRQYWAGERKDRYEKKPRMGTYAL